MKAIVQFVSLIFFSSLLYGQNSTAPPPFNLDFENIKNGKAVGWQYSSQNGYTASLDPNTTKEGKYAAYIASDAEGSDFNAWSFQLPKNYSGKKITLSGYIKTEGVADGYAGLWMRIDPRVGFDNMYHKGITGTTDWQKHEITLKLNPERTTQIVIGALLSGKGKMWFDDLSIKIDKKDVMKAKEYQPKLYPADSDHAFDKGSKISHIATSQHNLESLRILGLVWGFTKYYHPSVAQGKHNIDYELFRVLPKVLKTKTNAERDAVLVKWIKALGNVVPSPSKIQFDSSETKIIPDLKWIESSDFSEELSSLLLNLKQAKRSSTHHYIGFAVGVNNPKFKHEKAYQEMTYPDAGFRLLALFRYWNIIQYYFPYKNLIQENWKEVLEEFIPKFIVAENETKYHLRVLELIGRVHDSHAGLRTWSLFKHFGQKFAAPELYFIEDKAVVTGFYNDSLGVLSGMQVGDILLSIDGEKVDDFVKNRLIHAPASNYPTQLRNLAFDLLRTNNSAINIQFSRDGVIKEATLNTYSTKLINLYKNRAMVVESYRELSEEIGYINNGSLKKKDISEIREKIRGKKGIIIDIRNYPSDFPINKLSRALSSSKKDFVKFSKGSVQTPGLFTYTKTMTAGGKNKDPFTGKIILLVNEISQSSAEFHAMAYQTLPNSMVIGSTTAGADGNISSILIPGGLKTNISGIGVYYPDGRETQRVGIVPDLEVKPTIQGVIEGKDEVLEKAIELIEKE